MKSKMENKKEIIYYYPNFIKGRAFVVARFENADDADMTFKLKKYDETFTYEGKVYNVDFNDGVFRRDVKIKAMLLGRFFYFKHSLN